MYFYIDGLLSDVFYMWSCDSFYSYLLGLWPFTFNLELSLLYIFDLFSLDVAWILFGANRTPPFNPWSKKNALSVIQFCDVMSIDVFTLFDVSCGCFRDL